MFVRFVRRQAGIALGVAALGLIPALSWAQAPPIGAAGVCGADWQRGCRGAMPTMPKSQGQARAPQGNAGMNAMMGAMNVMGMVLDGIAQMEAQQSKQRAVQAESLNQQGAAFYNRGDWQAASNAFAQALQLQPDDQNIRSNLLEANRMLRARAEEAAARNRQQLDESRQRIGAMLGELQGGEARPKGPGEELALGPSGTAFFGAGGGGAPPAAKSGKPSGAEGAGLDFATDKESLYSKGNKWSAAPDLRPSVGKPAASDGLDFTTAAPKPINASLSPPRPSPTRKDADSLIRKAMEKSAGDWERARARLASQARSKPQDQEAQTALRRFEGLYGEYRRDVAQGESATRGASPQRPTAGIVPPRQIPEGEGEAAWEANRLGNEAYYDAANGDMVSARQRLEQAARLMPKDAGVNGALERLDRLEAAADERLQRRLAGEAPQWAAPEAQARAKAKAIQGRWALEHGYYDVAAEAYADAYIWDPSRRSAYHHGYAAASLGAALHQGRRRNPVAQAGPSLLEAPGDEPGLLEGLRPN